MKRKCVSFLSDYGLADEFVGVVKAVIALLADDAVVVDVTHSVPPFDIRSGSLTLMRSAQYLPQGVILAIVDPGVGTSRSAIAVETFPNGVAGGPQYLVGPDNGLLAPSVAILGGPARVVQISNPTLRLPAPGETFAGRDVFAPAAAHLVGGGELGELGPAIDPALLAPGLIALPHEVDGDLVCEVIWVDHFGNAQLNVSADDFQTDELEVQIGERHRKVKVVKTFSDLPESDLGVVVDSYGQLTLALNQGSASQMFRLSVGTKVLVRR